MKVTQRHNLFEQGRFSVECAFATTPDPVARASDCLVKSIPVSESERR